MKPTDEQIKAEANRLFPVVRLSVDRCFDSNAADRYNWTKGAEYGYSLASQWISICHKSPENKQSVLMGNSVSVESGVYYKDKNVYKVGSLVVLPTHWMPLPNPPKK